MVKKKLTCLKRIATKAVGVCLSVTALLSLSSCEAIKVYFAGEMTDTGISIDSIACGNVYSPTDVECSISKSPYDTVFDNCLFVGNTVMCDFYKSVELWREKEKNFFGSASFFCNENFSVYENNYTNPELASSHHPTVLFEGKDLKCTVEDAVEKTGVSRVVICLAGINDLPVYGDEANCHTKTANEMSKLVRALKKRFSTISVIVVGTPPISSTATHMKSVNNEKIALLNEELRKACTENGADFIDVFPLLSGDDGALKEEYCSDGYCKLTESGCKVILASLRYYAKERKGEI